MNTRKGGDSMDSKSTHQNKALIKRTKKCCLLLLGFLILFAYFGIRLATTESPEKWKEADITVADIQHISLKPNHWQITDTNGNIYSVYESDTVMEQIILQSAYHIVYSPNHNNGIRAITHGNTIIVDCAHSISIHSERNVWDWALMSLGLVGSLATIACMIIDIRKQIRYG